MNLKVKNFKFEMGPFEIIREDLNQSDLLDNKQPIYYKK